MTATVNIRCITRQDTYLTQSLFSNKGVKSERYTEQLFLANSSPFTKRTQLFWGNVCSALIRTWLVPPREIFFFHLKKKKKKKTVGDDLKSIVFFFFNLIFITYPFSCMSSCSSLLFIYLLFVSRQFGDLVRDLRPASYTENRNRCWHHIR